MALRWSIADVDLLCHAEADGPVDVTDAQDHRPLERVLLAHLDLHARAQAQGLEEGDDVGPGRPGDGDHGTVARLQRAERRERRQLVDLVGGDREAVRAGLGAVERHVDPAEDLLGQLVLEGDGVPIRLVPRVAEHVRQEALDDAVAADGRDGRPPPGGGERDAAVRVMLDQRALRQALHRRRRGGRRRAQALREGTRRGLATVGRQAVEGLEGLMRATADRLGHAGDRADLSLA